MHRLNYEWKTTNELNIPSMLNPLIESMYIVNCLFYNKLHLKKKQILINSNKLVNKQRKND